MYTNGNFILKSTDGSGKVQCLNFPEAYGLMEKVYKHQVALEFLHNIYSGAAGCASVYGGMIEWQSKDDLPAIEFVERNEDMSPDGKLMIYFQKDGDIQISILARDRHEDYLNTLTVEFCTLCAGGGRSKHTRKALYDLARAMELDNKERPIS